MACIRLVITRGLQESLNGVSLNANADPFAATATPLGTSAATWDRTFPELRFSLPNDRKWPGPVSQADARKLIFDTRSGHAKVS